MLLYKSQASLFLNNNHSSYRLLLIPLISHHCTKLPTGHLVNTSFSWPLAFCLQGHSPFVTWGQPFIYRAISFLFTWCCLPFFTGPLAFCLHGAACLCLQGRQLFVYIVLLAFVYRAVSFLFIWCCLPLFTGPLAFCLHDATDLCLQGRQLFVYMVLLTFVTGPLAFCLHDALQGGHIVVMVQLAVDVMAFVTLYLVQKTYTDIRKLALVLSSDYLGFCRYPDICADER